MVFLSLAYGNHISVPSVTVDMLEIRHLHFDDRTQVGVISRRRVVALLNELSSPDHWWKTTDKIKSLLAEFATLIFPQKYLH